MTFAINFGNMRFMRFLAESAPENYLFLESILLCIFITNALKNHDTNLTIV